MEVHRIIAMIFVFNPYIYYDDKQVNHIDGIKGHNWSWNLEWVTNKENMDHCIKTGLMTLGEKRKNSKFNNDQIEYICQLISEGKTDTEIKNLMNLNNCNVPKLVQNIKNGHCWKHISQNYDMSKSYKRRRFTDSEIHKICNYFELNKTANYNYKNVLEYIGIDWRKLDRKELNCIISCLSSIKNKKLFVDICNKYNY